MKSLLPALLLLSLLPALPAQNAPLDPSGAVVADVRLSREQLRELAGPIALYPDPLVAMILPASTFPSDVVLAARFVQSNDDPALADEKPWDESIRNLTRYPDVLAWMDENLEWTTQLGYAYLAQPEDVMDAIQELRGQAQTVGNLVDTPQQRVVVEESYIRIVPAQPEYIYVPYYDPEIVYYERPYNEPYLTFSAPWLVGAWLTFDFDWHRHRLYCGDWYGDWDYHHRRDRHDHRGENIYINNSFTNYNVWQGDSRRRLGSARVFAQNRDLLRQSNLAAPSYFQERFDVSERERRAVAVSSDVRQRDRRNAVGEVAQLDRARTKFGNDGRIRTQAGEQATLTKIADRENQRLAVESKKREEVRERLTAEGKISARDRDGKRVGAGGKMGDRGKVGADGRVTERTLPGETIKPGEAPKTGERGKGKMGDVSKEGERGKGRVTTPPTVTGEAPKIGDAPTTGERGKGKMGDVSKEGERAKGRVTTPPTVTGEAPKIGEAPTTGERGKGKMGDVSKEGERGKGGVTTPPTVTGEAPKVGEAPTTGERGKGKMGDVSKEGERGKGRVTTPPTVTGDLSPGKPTSDDAGKGKGKGKDADRGPSGQSEIPKAELPKGRPEVKEMPKVAPAPVIPDGTSKRGKGSAKPDSDDKGKGASPAPRIDPTPRSAPQTKQEAPKVRPQQPVNVDPPKPKVQTLPPPSVRPNPPQEKKKEKDQPSARKSAPSAPNVARQAPSQQPSTPAVERKKAPKPQVAAAPQPQPQKQVAAAPRPQPKPQKQVAAAPRPQPQKPAAAQPPQVAKPQILAAPKPQGGGGAKKPQEEEDKKKGKK